LRRNKPNHAGMDNAAFAEKIARDAVIYCHTRPLPPVFCGAQRTTGWGGLLLHCNFPKGPAWRLHGVPRPRYKPAIQRILHND
jgi:hypothetical protein